MTERGNENEIERNNQWKSNLDYELWLLRTGRHWLALKTHDGGDGGLVRTREGRGTRLGPLAHHKAIEDGHETFDNSGHVFSERG